MSQICRFCWNRNVLGWTVARETCLGVDVHCPGWSHLSEVKLKSVCHLSTHRDLIQKARTRTEYLLFLLFVLHHVIFAVVNNDIGQTDGVHLAAPSTRPEHAS